MPSLPLALPFDEAGMYLGTQVLHARPILPEKAAASGLAPGQPDFGGHLASFNRWCDAAAFVHCQPACSECSSIVGRDDRGHGSRGCRPSGCDMRFPGTRQECVSSAPFGGCCSARRRVPLPLVSQSLWIGRRGQLWTRPCCALTGERCGWVDWRCWRSGRWARSCSCADCCCNSWRAPWVLSRQSPRHRSRFPSCTTETRVLRTSLWSTRPYLVSFSVSQSCEDAHFGSLSGFISDGTPLKLCSASTLQALQ